MRHQQNYHHLDLKHKWEEVKQLGHIVQNRVEDPIGCPMGELRIVSLFPAELRQEEECLVGWVQEVAEHVDEDQKCAAHVDEKRVAEDVEQEGDELVGD